MSSARPQHPAPSADYLPALNAQGSAPNALAGYENELPASSTLVENAQADPRRAALNKKYPSYLPLNGPRSIVSLGNGISERLTNMRIKSLKLRNTVRMIKERLDALNIFLQTSGKRLQGDERADMLSRVTQILRDLDTKVQALDNSTIGENGLKKAIYDVNTLVTRLEAQSGISEAPVAPVTASASASASNSASGRVNSSAPVSAAIPTVRQLLRREPSLTNNAVRQATAQAATAQAGAAQAATAQAAADQAENLYLIAYPNRPTEAQVASAVADPKAELPATPKKKETLTQDEVQRAASAYNYLRTFNNCLQSPGNQIDCVKDALKWFEVNVWKRYVYKSKTVYSLGYSPEFRGLLTKEFNLLHIILKALNTKLGNKEIEDKIIDLYKLFKDAEVKKSIEHAIRYYSETLDTYNSYGGYIRNSLLNLGITDTKGRNIFSYETPYLSNNETRFFTKKRGTDQYPNDEEQTKGWEMVFAILSAIGGQTFVPEDKLGESIPEVLKKKGAKGGRRTNRKLTARKTKSKKTVYTRRR